MRYSIRLYNHYKDFNRFFKENKIDVAKEQIDMYYMEFCTSKSLRKYQKDSEKFFDYLINRFHMIGTFNMFEYGVPLEYKGYTASYSYAEKEKLYMGFVDGHFDCDIKGSTMEEIEEDFKNTVDYVLN